MRDRKIIAKIIIKEFGGTKNTAIHCGLAPSSVSDWKTKGMPKAWIRHFETLRPDLLTDCKDFNDPISDVLADSTNTPTE